MEIHPPPHIHSNKKFKEYALEFLMIFLAVSAVFFAEKIREHQSDRAKENGYMGSFIKNLEMIRGECGRRWNSIHGK